MAIDTAEKRRNTVGLWPPLHTGVTPNASKDQEWRQQTVWSYGGIAAGGAVVEEVRRGPVTPLIRPGRLKNP